MNFQSKTMRCGLSQRETYDQMKSCLSAIHRMGLIGNQFLHRVSNNKLEKFFCGVDQLKEMQRMHVLA